MTRNWDEKNRPRGDNFTNNLQPSLSLQIVTTAPPFQLTMAVFFQVILSWLRAGLLDFERRGCDLRYTIINNKF